MTKVNIVIIDDHQLFREGVKRILDFEPSFEVVAEGDDGTKLESFVEHYHPDVVIMDINMPNMNGVEATKQLVDYIRNRRSLFYRFMMMKTMYTCIKNRSTGYLLKEMDADTLIEAVKVVAEGGSYLHPKVTHNLVKEYPPSSNKRCIIAIQHEVYPEIRRPLHIATRSECEVLQMLADGKSNRAIGETLYISEKTVKNHVSNILQKMNVNDRTQAVVVAIKNGWVEMR